MRESELFGWMAALDELDLGSFEYISVHAPSRLRSMKESVAAELLLPCVERKWPVVLHPDTIGDYECWRDFGRWACIENMDNRKCSGRTSQELSLAFERLPEASFAWISVMRNRSTRLSASPARCSAITGIGWYRSI